MPLLRWDGRKRVLTLQRAVEMLSDAAVANRDNPHVPEEIRFIPTQTRDRIRAWEEAPLLDEIAVNAGYRGTLVNLGLAYVHYDRLDEYVRTCGGELAGQMGIGLDQLEHVCPEHIQQADWERRMKQPQGYPMTPGGEPEAFLEGERVPYGIRCHNAWRKPKSGGRGPSLERLLKHLLKRFGGQEPDAEQMVGLISFLKKGSFLAPIEVCGARDKTKLLQINEEVVRLQLAAEDIRMHCDVCGAVLSGAAAGMPCPKCHGTLVRWSDREVNASRSVRRIKKPQTIPLVAKEHTAQITTDDRLDYETAFKAPAAESKVNVLACSPTLEMGIDVGGLDAVVMRNIPPRPDNYAQRGVPRRSAPATRSVHP
jgi:uncharacterized Zn finger protein (UPF0148 family)